MVLKRPRLELASDRKFTRMLAAEARLSERLHHPNVVRTLSAEQLDGIITLVLEYVQGTDLRTLLAALSESGPPPPGLAAYVVHEVCRGLAHAHGFHIVHRDVAPANVMLSRTGEVKLADFGIAKALAAADETTRTATGTLRGNLAYMAPEQLEGADFDERADIYAAGVMLHETLCARRLFKGAPDPAHMKALRQLKIEPPSAKNPAVPPELDRICERAMARTAADRFESASEMAAALDPFVIDFGPRELGALLAQKVPEKKEEVEVPVAADERRTATGYRRPGKTRFAWIAAAMIGLLGIVGWVVVQKLRAQTSEAITPTSTSTSTSTPTPTTTPTPAPTSTSTSRSTSTTEEPPRKSKPHSKDPRSPDLAKGKLLNPFRP